MICISTKSMIKIVMSLFLKNSKYALKLCRKKISIGNFLKKWVISTKNSFIVLVFIKIAKEANSQELIRNINGKNMTKNIANGEVSLKNLGRKSKDFSEDIRKNTKNGNKIFNKWIQIKICKRKFLFGLLQNVRKSLKKHCSKNVMPHARRIYKCCKKPLRK